MIGKMKKKEKEKEKEADKDQQNSTEMNDGQNTAEGSQKDETTDAKEEENAPAAECKDKDQQIAELNDKYLRLYAEFDNYRRRTQRERADLIQSAASDLMTALLPTLDDFDRAVAAFDQSTEVNALKEGVQLIQQKFKKVLNQKGLEEMKSIGEIFNTDFHEAVANIPAEKEDDKQKVLDEVEKGYFLNGKVIRFARVVVGN